MIKENILGADGLKLFNKGDCVSFVDVGEERNYGIVFDIFIKEIENTYTSNRKCAMAKIRTMKGSTVEILITSLKLEAKVKHHERREENKKRHTDS